MSSRKPPCPPSMAAPNLGASDPSGAGPHRKPPPPPPKAKAVPASRASASTAGPSVPSRPPAQQRVKESWEDEEEDWHPQRGSAPTSLPVVHIEPYYLAWTRKGHLCLWCQEKSETLMQYARNLAYDVSESVLDFEAPQIDDSDAATIVQLHRWPVLSRQLVAVGGPHDGMKAWGLGTNQEIRKRTSALALHLTLCVRDNMFAKTKFREFPSMQRLVQQAAAVKDDTKAFWAAYPDGIGPQEQAGAPQPAPSTANVHAASASAPSGPGIEFLPLVTQAAQDPAKFGINAAWIDQPGAEMRLTPDGRPWVWCNSCAEWFSDEHIRSQKHQGYAAINRGLLQGPYQAPPAAAPEPTTTFAGIISDDEMLADARENPGKYGIEDVVARDILCEPRMHGGWPNMYCLYCKKWSDSSHVRTDKHAKEVSRREMQTARNMNPVSAATRLTRQPPPVAPRAPPPWEDPARAPQPAAAPPPPPPRPQPAGPAGHGYGNETAHPYRDAGEPQPQPQPQQQQQQHQQQQQQQQPNLGREAPPAPTVDMLMRWALALRKVEMPDFAFRDWHWPRGDDPPTGREEEICEC